MTVQARSPTGVQDGPVTLRLVKRPTVSLRGRVLGPGGRPVAGARVRISFRTGNEQNVYGDGKDEEIRTGPDGTFRTPDGVPRSDQYRRLRHRRGDGAGRVGLGEGAGRRTARRDPAPGRRGCGRSPAGWSTPTARRWPGPRSSSRATGRGGRATRPTPTAGSRSPGSSTRRRFVFVKKAGYRFAGRRIGAGDEPVEVVVSKVDGPAPPP